MEIGYSQYHRSGYSINNEKLQNPAEDYESNQLLPTLIMKESELLYINDPEKVLREYMKLRNWTYKLDVTSEGNQFKAEIDIESEDVFSQTSNNEKKAMAKAIISVLYHYNSMFASIWIARHQNALKEYIRQ